MSLLDGVRVVEMGMWIAGPSAGGILADWGADVVKIEMLSGDPMRNLYGAMAGSKESRCPPFEFHNRGKNSVALDVNRPEGQALARRIASSADIFLSNMRPQFLRRVGLDHESLLNANPRLVYAILTGYGLEGPDRDAPGYDLAAFSARSGVTDRATPPNATPTFLPGAMGDNIAAITLVAGVMGALWYRERTGRGQMVSTSLLRTGIFCIGMDMSTRLGLGRVVPPPVRDKPQNPLMNSYRAADGKWLWLIGAEPERHWKPILGALDAPHLLDDSRFQNTTGRRRNSQALVAIFDEIFATKTRDRWAECFARHGVWWAPVNSAEDLLTDAQVQAVRAFIPVPSIAGDGTTIMSVASPVDFGAEPVAPAKAAPVLGNATHGVLHALGVGEADIARLRRDGVIG